MNNKPKKIEEQPEFTIPKKPLLKFVFWMEKHQGKIVYAICKNIPTIYYTLLGKLKWNDDQYCFYPEPNTIFSLRALEEINKFILEELIEPINK